jgi:hypothetical protein
MLTLLDELCNIVVHDYKSSKFQVSNFKLRDTGYGFKPPLKQSQPDNNDNISKPQFQRKS